MTTPRRRIALVTGLSGSGKSSVLRELEDLGYETVDNPPLPMLDEMVSRGDRNLAIGVDARTRGFDAQLCLDALGRLKINGSLLPKLIYTWADEATLLRRYTETRRRHPLAPQGKVADGIQREITLTEPLRSGADMVIDTSDLPLAALRRLIDRDFGADSNAAESRLVVSLISFAYRQGLPREADLVFDSRFLRNPHYDPILRDRTGLDVEVGAYIAADPDFATFFARVAELIDMLLPRFVQEGKKYATITIGCTGGRHRSVYLVEQLANRLADRIFAAQAPDDPGFSWRLYVTHRELAREGLETAYLSDRLAPKVVNAEEYRTAASQAVPVQAQEA
jgi:UPF0042 nucleotide-binding protein